MKCMQGGAGLAQPPATYIQAHQGVRKLLKVHGAGARHILCLEHVRQEGHTGGRRLACSRWASGWRCGKGGQSGNGAAAALRPPSQLCSSAPASVSTLRRMLRHIVSTNSASPRSISAMSAAGVYALARVPTATPLYRATTYATAGCTCDTAALPVLPHGSLPLHVLFMLPSRQSVATTTTTLGVGA